MMARIRLFLLFIIWLSVSVASYSLDNPHNATKDLIRRQCVWNSVTQQYDCNEFLPTPQQIAYQMRDVDGNCMVGSSTRLMFHANLFPGKTTPLSDDQVVTAMTWCTIWMYPNHLTDIACK